MQSTLQVLLVVSVAVCVTATSKFGYAVNDPLTGDNKDQQEVRVGDSVVGYYRMADADGLLRTVNYQADPINGFTAQVERSPYTGAAVPPSIPISRAGPIAPVQSIPQMPYYPINANFQNMWPAQYGNLQQKYIPTGGLLPAGSIYPYQRK